MESKLKLSQYLELAIKFSEDPSDKNLEELNEFINTIQVKEFMPLADKEIVCGRILSVLNDDFSAMGVARFIEMGRIIYGLLGYCVNFENDLDTIALSTPSIYDTIVMNGLYDYILNKCFADYNRLLKYYRQIAEHQFTCNGQHDDSEEFSHNIHRRLAYIFG